MIDNQTEIKAPELEALMEESNFSRIRAIEFLQQPTPQSLIQQRSQNGETFPYISGDAVTNLLNYIFGYRWSFSVKETKFVQAQPKREKNGTLTEQPGIVQVLGSMTVPGFGVKEQWGSSVLSGGAANQASAVKSATTDALKKCASLYGVGLDISKKPGTGSGMFHYGPADFLSELEETDKIDGYKEMRDRYVAHQKSQQELAKQQATPATTPDAPQPTPVQPQPNVPQEQQSSAAQQPMEWMTAQPQEQTTAKQTTVNVQDTPAPPTPQQEPVEMAQSTPVATKEPEKQGPVLSKENNVQFQMVLKEAGITNVTVLNAYIKKALNDPEATMLQLTNDNIGHVINEILDAMPK